MAADYIIDMDCPVKRAVGSEGLVRLLKQEGYAWFYLETYMQREGMSRDEALEQEMQVVVQRPEGDTLKKTTVREALNEVQVLAGLSQHCKSCPVSLGENFGCSQSINYPITEKCEQWLASLVQKKVDKGVENSSIMRVLVNGNVPSQRYADLRRTFAGKILAGSKAIEIVYKKSFLSKKSVNTDQLFQLLIGHPVLPPELAGALGELGGEMKAVHVIDGDGILDEKFIEDTLTGKAKPTRWEFKPEPGDTSDRGISQFQRYFHALALAAVEKVSVNLDA